MRHVGETVVHLLRPDTGGDQMTVCGWGVGPLAPIVTGYEPLAAFRIPDDGHEWTDDQSKVNCDDCLLGAARYIP